MQVRDRENHFVVVPVQVAIYKLKGFKIVFVLIIDDIRMIMTEQEWFEVHRLVGLIIKNDLDFEVAEIGCFGDTAYFGIDLAT